MIYDVEPLFTNILAIFFDEVSAQVFPLFFKIRLFVFSPCWKREGIFLRQSLQEPGWAPESKTNERMGTSCDWVPWSFQLSDYPHWTSSKSSVIGCPVQAIVPLRVFCFWVVLLYIHLSGSPNFGATVCGPTSMMTVRKVIHFSVFQFLLVVRTQWQLASSLHAGPGTRSALI